VHIEVEGGEGDGLAVGVFGCWLFGHFDGGLGCDWANLCRGLAVFVGGAGEDDFASGRGALRLRVRWQRGSGILRSSWCAALRGWCGGVLGLAEGSRVEDSENNRAIIRARKNFMNLNLSASSWTRQLRCGHLRCDQPRHLRCGQLRLRRPLSERGAGARPRRARRLPRPIRSGN